MGRTVDIFGRRWRVAQSSPKPAWVQIEEQIADRIESGALAAGQRLPAERILAESLGVSRMTVRQALASLAARALVERGVGRGTFVRRGPRVVHDLTRVSGFTEEAQRQGLEPGARIVEARERPAPDHVAVALGIEPDAPALRIERVRLAGDRPVANEDTWMPAERFPGLLREDLAGSLYTLMRTRYGLGPVSATERFEPVAARSYEAQALDVEEGTPLMLIERIAYAADGIPVEFARDRHRGDRTQFVTHVVPDDVLARDSRPAMGRAVHRGG
jgi:DNA-binding GntR family transcriptional regulator